MFESTERQDVFGVGTKRNVYFRRKVPHYTQLLRPGRRLYGGLILLGFLSLLAKFALISTLHEFSMVENGFRTKVKDKSIITNHAVIEEENASSGPQILSPGKFPVSPFS